MNPRSIARTALPLLFAVAAVACASQQPPPRSLVEAREEIQRAKEGPAAKLDPADVHEADVALQTAEQAYRQAPRDPSTNDLAVVADRRALIAESEATAIQARLDTQTARHALAAATAAQLQNMQSQLGQTQQALGATQMQLQDARDTIAKIAAVKDDDRGMVITLQGEVLFQTGKWDLKPSAMAKLDSIADALKGKEQPIAVFGFTDDVGGPDTNLALSQHRASSVRDYLVRKGVPQDLITAEGRGQDDPVSANRSVEGRAMNRRVEIVVRPKTH